MRTFFVTRHQGAIDWAREEGHIDDQTDIVSTLKPETVQPGDLVIGTLPAHLAARIVERGGRYQHLVLDISEGQRGLELSVADMRAGGARLEELFIQRASVPSPRGREILHICIASEQTLPNLILTQVPELKPSAVFILSSQRMENEAKRLRFGLSKSGFAENQIRIQTDMPDHDMNAIVAYGNTLIQTLRGDYPRHRWVLNATGGTKPMSNGLMQALRPYAEILYCDTAHDRIEVLHPPGQANRKLPVNLIKLDSYLAAQGYVTSEGKDQSGERMARRELTQYLVENATRLDGYFGSLNWAATQIDKNQPNDAWVKKPTATAEVEVHEHLIAAGMLENHNGQARMKQQARAYLGGGWLEEWCWVVGQQLEDANLGVHRLHRNRWGVNVRIDPYDQQRDPRRPNDYSLNELDAAFVHRNRMLIVECKTGTQIADKDKSQAILNKLEVLGEHAAGRFATKWLLSARRVPKSGQILERAKRYRIEIIPPEELPKLKERLSKWMGT